MTSNRLARLRQKIIAEEQSGKGGKSDELRELTYDALYLTGQHALIEEMNDCGDKLKNPNFNDKVECGCLYCAKRADLKTKKNRSCYTKYVASQFSKVMSIIDKYPNEADQRDNLRHITILHHAINLDVSGPNPIIPYDMLCDAISDARKKINTAFAKKFPMLRYRGAFSIEIQHPDFLGTKKKNSLSNLLPHSQNEGFEFKQRDILGSLNSPWKSHIINVHSHIIVDLNGVDSDSFYEACHNKFGSLNNKRPIPDGVKVQTLFTTKTVEDSLASLVQYPFRNQFHYKYQYNNDEQSDIDNYKTKLEPELLSTLIVTLTKLKKNRHLLISRKW